MCDVINDRCILILSFSFSKNSALNAVSCSLAFLTFLDLLAASLFFLLFSQYISSLEASWCVGVSVMFFSEIAIEPLSSFPESLGIGLNGGEPVPDDDDEPGGVVCPSSFCF